MALSSFTHVQQGFVLPAGCDMGMMCPTHLKVFCCIVDQVHAWLPGAAVDSIKSSADGGML